MAKTATKKKQTTKASRPASQAQNAPQAGAPVIPQLDPKAKVTVNGKSLSLNDAKLIVLASLAKAHEHITHNNFELVNLVLNENYHDALYELIKYNVATSRDRFLETVKQQQKQQPQG